MNIWKFLRRFKRDHRGITGILLALIVALGFMAVAIPISLYVVVQIRDALPSMTANSLEANVTDAVFTNILNSYNIASILPYVLVGGVMITALIAGFALYGRRKG